MKTVLTVAGSDPSGGAGIQADLKTMTAHGVYGMSVLTALTAQNTCGVTGIHEVPPDFLALQLDAVFSDIRPDAIKLGMLASAPLIRVLAAKLREESGIPIVLDPVMVSTSGSRLLDPDAVDALQTELFPLATLLTPNLPETEALTGRTIRSVDELCEAARELHARFGCAVLCKGGHLAGTADDLLCADGRVRRYTAERVETKNTHGTGCTLSSAIACSLAQGYPLAEAVSRAKSYLTGALADGLSLGHGNGPVNHAYCLRGTPFAGEYTEEKKG